VTARVVETPPFPLYDRYPQLATSLPRLPLHQGPTPVAELTQLGGKAVWVKNDGFYGTIYGGNKPRKLEFILPDVQRTGATTIVTVGGLGTHHGLATALYARQQGLQTVLMLVDQPVDDVVRRELCWFQEAGAILHHTATAWRTRLLVPAILLRYTNWRRRKLPYVLPPGGSTPLSGAGYVNAALELAAQVASKELPEPKTIVVALGSAGTAAGLALGLRLAGLSSRLVGVRVSDTLTLTSESVARLANATAALMRRRGADLPSGEVNPADITVVSDWLGPGYGHPTAEGRRVQTLLRDKHGLALDLTYTAKTMAAVLALLEDGRLEGPTLYWHTYNALPPPFPEPGPEDYRQLPRAFHRFFE